MALDHYTDNEIVVALNLLALDLPRLASNLHLGCEGGVWWARVGDDTCAVRASTLGGVLCAVARRGHE